jgi:hypothetical protein
MPITVAISGEASLDDCCTKCGYLLLALPDGMIYWQLCFYCANVVETIISLQAVLASSDAFTSWTQTGYKDGRPGSIHFDSEDSLLTMKLSLDYHDGFYYCPSVIITVAPSNSEQPMQASHPNHFIASHVAYDTPVSTLGWPSKYSPTSKDKQLKSELRLLCLGSLGISQLDQLPGNATGLPSVFKHHPF